MTKDLEIDISNNYIKAIKNAIRSKAPEKSLLVLKYLYMHIIDGEILTHESAKAQVLECSKQLARMTDFTEDNICKIMYDGDEEQMDWDYNEAVQMQGANDVSM